jgi:hypothetical protein
MTIYRGYYVSHELIIALYPLACSPSKYYLDEQPSMEEKKKGKQQKFVLALFGS